MDKSAQEMVWVGVSVTIAIVVLRAFVPQVKTFTDTLGKNIVDMITKSFKGWDMLNGGSDDKGGDKTPPATDNGGAGTGAGK